MGWQLFLFFSVLAESFGRLMQRFLLKDNKSDPVAYAAFSQILTGLLIGIIAFSQGFKIPPLEPIFLNLLLTPVLWGLANILIFKALKQTEASLFMIFFSTKGIWIVLAAMAILHESFTLTQFFGTLLIIGSVIIVSWKKGKIKFQKGEILALCSAILLGGAIINDALVIKTFDVLSYTSFDFLAPGLFIWFTNLKKTKEIVRIVKSPALSKIAIMSLLYGISIVFYFSAYKIGNNAAQIASLFQTSSILSVILAIVILKERSHLLVKLIAAVLSFVGVLLVK